MFATAGALGLFTGQKASHSGRTCMQTNNESQRNSCGLRLTSFYVKQYLEEDNTLEEEEELLVDSGVGQLHQFPQRQDVPAQGLLCNRCHGL